jgi:hypothetical protein
LPGLSWSDVDAMPTLRGLMARGSVGSLTAKAGGTLTDCLSGSLTFSAGNRAVPTGPDCPVPAGGWASLRSANLHSEYAADVGALGTALQAGGFVGAAQGSTGSRVVAVLDTGLYDLGPGVSEHVREGADRVADGELSAALSGLPSGSTVIVTATADLASGPAALHPLVIVGPGWAHRELSFPGSRAPYVELIDLAPTILRSFGLPVPATMVGKPLTVTGAAVRTPSAYLDQDRHARADASVAPTVLLVLGWVTVLVLLLAAAGRREVTAVARVLAPLPLVSFLVNLLPWWRWDRWVYVVFLAAGALLGAAATTLLARRGALAAGLAVPVVSLVALAADQLAGAPMQLSSPLGYSPIPAGRFVGVGNLDFAVIATAAVVIAALAGAGRSRRGSLLLAGSVLLVALVVDAAPPLGDDAGGLLALAPASVVVLAVLAGVRLSARRIVAIVGGTALLAVAVGLADYSRPASSQTHIGQFVGQVLHGGGAGTEVGRKAHAALGTVGVTISTILVVVALVVALLRRQRVRRAVEGSAGLLALLAGVVTVAVLGSALNDSGLNVAAMVLTVAVSAVFSVQWARVSPIRQEAATSAAATTTTSTTASADNPDSPGR